MTMPPRRRPSGIGEYRSHIHRFHRLHARVACRQI